jgi:hypothetical protein
MRIDIFWVLACIAMKEIARTNQNQNIVRGGGAAAPRLIDPIKIKTKFLCGGASRRLTYNGTAINEGGAKRHLHLFGFYVLSKLSLL